MPAIDLSRIEDTIWRENYLVLLGFPAAAPYYRGYIPLRVMAREQFYFMYDPLQEGQITAKIPAAAGANGISDLGFVKPALPGGSFVSGKPGAVLYIMNSSRLDQRFLGV